ncbi:MAG: bacteriohemerythrin [Acidobacteriaceae bacterium]
MASFKWDETYSVRVQRCDAQHKKLFNIINQLADAMRVAKGQEVIAQIVGQLIAYTRTHFQQEEALMEQAQYPELSAHQQLHRELVADVEKFQRELDEGLRPNTVAILDFLKDWLTQHIQKVDKAYSEHLNSHGIS